MSRVLVVYDLQLFNAGDLKIWRDQLALSLLPLISAIKEQMVDEVITIAEVRPYHGRLINLCMSCLQNEHLGRHQIIPSLGLACRFSDEVPSSPEHVSISSAFSSVSNHATRRVMITAAKTDMIERQINV